MDLLKILRSLEELLYEVLTWLLFYPQTLWRIVWHPRAMADYAERELRDKPDDRFTDAISPPLFLMLSIALAHGLELAFRMETGVPTSSILSGLLASDQNLLLFRSLVFSIWPLVAAVTAMRLKRETIDRESLRPIFFGQCYLAGAFAVAFSVGGLLGRKLGYGSGGGVIVAIAFIWYLWVLSQWFRHRLGIGWPRAVGHALLVFAAGALINLTVLVSLLWSSVR